MKKARFWIAVALGAALALFALQNLAAVDITFLFWTFETSRIFVLAATFAIGLAIGWIVKSLQRARHAHEP